MKSLIEIQKEINPIIMGEKFNKWFLETFENSKITYNGKIGLKLLVGDMWVKFCDLPDLMQKAIIDDFKKQIPKQEESTEPVETGSCLNSTCRRYLYNGKDFCDDDCEDEYNKY